MIIKRQYHGLSKTSEYRIWRNIKSRCLNPNLPKYKYYGGRGIKICNQWRDSFMAFFDYVGKRPSPKHTIDRIRNNGHYEPGNIRWSTRQEQANNRRSSALITHNGVSKTIAQWSRVRKINQTRLRQRMARDGWSVERALFEPVSHTWNKKLYGKDRHKIRKLYKETNISQRALAKMFDVDQALIWKIVNNKA